MNFACKCAVLCTGRRPESDEMLTIEAEPERASKCSVCRVKNTCAPRFVFMSESYCSLVSVSRHECW